MAFYDKFPYTNFQELNLDRIIQELIKVKEGLNFVIENASLKYADPIQWNITKQYQANTVVIDPATGIAYLSTKPVPDNVNITDTNYWTQIFDLSVLYDTIKEAISANIEPSMQASEAYPKNSMIWVDNDMYRALVDIPAAAVLVEGVNVEKSDVNTILLNFITSTETDINTFKETLEQEFTDFQTEVNNSIAELEETIPMAMFINVKEHDLTGDGITDDSAALNALIASTEAGTLFFPQGTYLIGNITLPAAKQISFIGEPNMQSVLKINADNIPLFREENSFNSVIRTFRNFTIDGNGKTNTIVFDFKNCAKRELSNIYFKNCVTGLRIDGSRNLTVRNILQKGDLKNVITSTQMAQNIYNWDAIIDGWQTETNNTPNPTGAWFTLTGMICSQFSNIITEGRLECIAFDLVGMNEGTFFSNCVIVCPTFGFRILTSGGVQPACVDLSNVSIDQPYGGGIIADVWWLMVNNFACVNGNQRNNTDAAIIIQTGAKDVFINNALVYNMRYTGISIGAAERVFISNSSVKQGTVAGYAYSCPGQTAKNPHLINNDFESVEPVSGLTYQDVNQFQ